MNEQKPASNADTAKVSRATHRTVHAIQYRDAKGNVVEIAPKTDIAAASLKDQIGDVADLEKRGAIRRITKDDLASEVVKS